MSKTKTLVFVPATLVLGCSLLAAVPAFADDAPAADPNATPAPATASAGAGVSTAPVATAPGEWGDAILDRTYTLPAKKMAVYGDFDVLNIGLGDLGSVSVQSLHAGIGYGVNDKLTAGIEYSVDLHDDGGSFPSDDRYRGPLQPYVTYQIVHNEKLDVAATGQLVIDLNAGTDQNGDKQTNLILGAQISARYKVSPKVAIFTGQPQGPGPAGGGLFGLAGLLSNQFIIGLNNDQQGELLIPVGVGIQAAPKVYLYALTDLVGVRLVNKPDGADTASFIGSDAGMGGLGIPLGVGGYFAAAKNLDVGVTAGFVDLNHAGDLYAISFGAKYYSK